MRSGVTLALEGRLRAPLVFPVAVLTAVIAIIACVTPSTLRHAATLK